MGLFQEVRKIETDVLIIGSGVAGMMAAVGAIRCGVKPTIVTKATFPSGSSSMARGGYTVAIGHAVPEDKPEFLYEDSVLASFGLCNRRLMRIMSRETIDRTYELDAWGLGLVKLEDGRFHQKKSASHRYPRLVHCGKLMGKPLMATLSKKMKEWEVDHIPHVILVDLMCEGGRVVGAWGFHYREGTPLFVHARSTVLATGGAPQLHELNDSPPTISGDGYAMALRAGADLIDMEFIDYQLLTAAPPQIAGYPPHTSGFINAGAYLLNREGDRFMRHYDPERWERSTRAMVNRGVAMEIFNGRGTENGAVFLDARHVFEEVDEGVTSDTIRAFKNCGVDMRTTPIEVTSGPHTYLGGVLIDEWGRTTVQGLYAGGEATGGVHGANRTGGAALADSYVFGLRSGMCAACESRLRERIDPEDGGWRERFDL
ncbi:MAG: FAD-binding protein, partial [Nitrospinota bacterium]|nr:FAD-binding protein [Nitrospinota bacterium]